MTTVQLFNDLQTKWKVLSVVGMIALFIILGLIVFVIIIFKTDLIPIEAIIGVQEFNDISDEDSDFIDSLVSSEPSIPLPPVKRKVTMLDDSAPLINIPSLVITGHKYLLDLDFNLLG